MFYQIHRRWLSQKFLRVKSYSIFLFQFPQYHEILFHKECLLFRTMILKRQAVTVTTNWTQGINWTRSTPRDQEPLTHLGSPGPEPLRGPIGSQRARGPQLRHRTRGAQGNNLGTYHHRAQSKIPGSQELQGLRVNTSRHPGPKEFSTDNRQKSGASSGADPNKLHQAKSGSKTKMHYREGDRSRHSIQWRLGSRT